jgi:hypothetical protein
LVIRLSFTDKFRFIQFSDQKSAAFSFRTCQCSIYWYDFYYPFFKDRNWHLLLIWYLQKKHW